MWEKDARVAKRLVLAQQEPALGGGAGGERAQRCHHVSRFPKGDSLCVGPRQVDKVRPGIEARGIRLSNSASQS